MIVLGINSYHADSAACLLRDGSLVAAAEEERFRRIKHWAGFPSQAITYCLKEAGVSLSDVDVVAVNRNNRASLGRKFAYVLISRPSLKLITDRYRTRSRSVSIESELSRVFPGESFKGRVEQVEHHFAHLASAFYVSPFPEAAAASVDGFGDFASAAWGVGQGSSLSLDGRVLFPHSLGIFYQAMTQYLGFYHYGDEYKVMGLAAYGNDSLVSSVQPLVELKKAGGFELNLDYFRHHRESLSQEWNGGEPICDILYSNELVSALGPGRAPNDPLTDRYRNLAFATQSVFEEAYFHFLTSVAERYKTDALVLAGGCAYNSVANGKIYRRTPFRRSYLQSAAGDAGGAIGAALAVWHRLGGKRAQSMSHAYWGPGWTDLELQRCAISQKDALADRSCSVRTFDDDEQLAEWVAAEIASGKVVGWFQGRMEWGPRALGNRSILGDPRRADMKDLLNLKIKRRESFRPFAPSVLRQEVRNWFESEDDVPFMLQVLSIRVEQRAKIPAVTHVDGTGRLQTVTKEANHRYFTLIEAFNRLTGVPMLLNTSFNENEPVVCRPQEALDCFLRTNMDVLVLGPVVMTRHPPRNQEASGLQDNDVTATQVTH